MPVTPEGIAGRNAQASQSRVVKLSWDVITVGARLVAVMSFTVSNGKITEIGAVVSPERDCRLGRASSPSDRAVSGG